jgi:glycosyltransferase involved in cell wall biosynthesis
LNICLLGDSSGNPDEGMKIIAGRLRRELSKRHGVLALDPRRIHRAGFWRDLRECRPDILHYIPGPSIASCIVLKLLGAGFPKARTVLSAPMPSIRSWTTPILPLLRPDLVLAQSVNSGRLFQRWGMPVEYLPISGVDTEIFRPVSKAKKAALRRRYGVRTDQYVVLHVGNIKRKRNVQLFSGLSSRRILPVLVGSTSAGMETPLREELTSAGCIVITDYLDCVEEYYQLADCYVFPIPAANTDACIQFPLSILEAAACDLPILSTRFGAIAEIFGGVSGVQLFDRDEDILQAIRTAADGKRTNGGKTREVATRYSWKRIIPALEKSYAELAGRTPGRGGNRTPAPGNPADTAGSP